MKTMLIIIITVSLILLVAGVIALTYTLVKGKKDPTNNNSGNNSGSNSGKLSERVAKRAEEERKAKLIAEKIRRRDDVLSPELATEQAALRTLERGEGDEHVAVFKELREATRQDDDAVAAHRAAQERTRHVGRLLHEEDDPQKKTELQQQHDDAVNAEGNAFTASVQAHDRRVRAERAAKALEAKESAEKKALLDRITALENEISSLTEEIDKLENGD